RASRPMMMSRRDPMASDRRRHQVPKAAENRTITSGSRPRPKMPRMPEIEAMSVRVIRREGCDRVIDCMPMDAPSDAVQDSVFRPLSIGFKSNWRNWAFPGLVVSMAPPSSDSGAVYRFVKIYSLMPIFSRGRALPAPTEVKWRHRFSVLASATTVLLLGWGAFVTSINAGLAVPDWPSSFNSYDPFNPWPEWWKLTPVLAEHG